MQPNEEQKKNRRKMKNEDISGVDLLFHRGAFEYTTTLIVFTFIAIVVTLEVFIEETSLQRLEKCIPKSVILILVGLIGGGGCFLLVGKSFFHRLFGPRIYFDYLLPPIILDATYELYSREFFLQIDGILLLAVVGTTLNIFAIGASLYLVSELNLLSQLSLANCFIYSSIVAAVDPVAVLAVFEELGVQRSLSILILGESLLNDGVTVVFFETLREVSELETDNPQTYVFIVLSFFTTSFGGFLVGAIHGCFTALLCKYTSKRTKMLELPIILGFAYLSYLNSLLFRWSGIMAIIGCGLVQKRYALPNLFRKSHKTVERATKVLAHVADTIIFLLFGLNIYRLQDIDLSFMIWTVVFCTIYRPIFVSILGAIINRGRTTHRLTLSHMFIMSYGGLRGAVSYVMASSVTGEDAGRILSGTMALILFTCFLQGGTVEIWVKFLRFEEPEQSLTFLKIAIERVSKHIMTGMSAIMGGSGSGSKLLSWIEVLDYYDKKHVQPVLCWRGCDDDRGLKELEEKRDATVLDLYRDPRLLGMLRYAQDIVNESLKPSKKMSESQKKVDLKKMKKLVERAFDDSPTTGGEEKGTYHPSFYNRME